MQHAPRVVDLDGDLRDGDVIRAGGIRLEVLHTPGQTPGSVCFAMPDGAGTAIFSGDTLFAGSIGRWDSAEPRWRTSCPAFIENCSITGMKRASCRDTVRSRQSAPSADPIRICDRSRHDAQAKDSLRASSWMSARAGGPRRSPRGWKRWGSPAASRGRGQIAHHARIPRMGERRASRRRSRGHTHGSAPRPSVRRDVDKIGAFPHERKPRVVWLGSHEQGRGFRDLSRDVQSAYEALGFTFAQEASLT